MAQSPQPTQPATTTLPSYPLKFGAFEARFDPGGTFTLQGEGWPALNGTWTSTGNEIALSMSGGPGGCDGPGRYQFRMNGKHLSLVLVSDDCKVRQMILDQSDWCAKRRGQGNSNSIHNLDGRRARAITVLLQIPAKETGLRSADLRLRAFLRDKICQKNGTAKRARTFCGGRQFPDSRIRVRWFGETGSL